MQTENVHLLVVEDNPRFLRELLEDLKEYGYQQIATATSAAQAQEKLVAPFDVIISDMRMEQDDSGFAVVNEVKARSLSSVVIILTANDTVSDCRDAFKLGAWDYISKNMRGDIVAALHESIQEAIAYFNRWGNVQNEQWIHENRETLEQTFWGQYIAVINRTVIDAAETEEALQRQIEERQLRRFLTTIFKVGDLRPIADLIKLPESAQLEYKSTLQWDVKQNCKNEALRLSVLKTIAAFLNSEGGTLIIGVEDNQNILGLDQDLSVLSKGTLDQFEQTIVNLIFSGMGASCTQFLKIRFEVVEEKEICAIDVRKSPKPVFLKSSKGLEFYIRAGNTSRSLDIPDLYDHF
jgi:ActR/RegA family two-component response regulator